MRLQDNRREKFCQLIIGGSTITNAYENAGYARNDGNASKLYHNVEIQARLNDLEIEKTEGMIKPIDDLVKSISSIEDLELTKTWVLEQLMLLTQKAKMDGQANAAYRCIELMGEYLGMWGGKGSGKGAEDANTTKKKTAKRQDMSSLSSLVQTFRVMDQKQKERDDNVAELAKGTEVNTPVSEPVEESIS